MSLKYFDKLRSLFHFGTLVLIIRQGNRIDVEPTFIVTPNFLWLYCTVIFLVINPQTAILSDDCDTKCILWFSYKIYPDLFRTQDELSEILPQTYASLRAKLFDFIYECKWITDYGKSVISPIIGPKCPEGSRNSRFPNYVTMAQDVGKIVSLTHRPSLPPGNNPGTQFC